MTAWLSHWTCMQREDVVLVFLLGLILGLGLGITLAFCVCAAGEALKAKTE